MATAKATTGGTIDAEITVAHLYDVGGSTATGTLSATVPVPAVLRDKAAATCAKGLVLAFALSDGRGIVNKWLSDLRICGCSYSQCRKNCM